MKITLLLPPALMALISGCTETKEMTFPDAAPYVMIDAGAFPSCGIPGVDHSNFGGRMAAAAGTQLEGTMTLAISLSVVTGQAAVSGSWTSNSGATGGLTGFIRCADGALLPCAERPSADGLCASLTTPGTLDNAGAFSGQLNVSGGMGNWMIDGNAQGANDAGPVSLHGHGTWFAQ